MLAIIPVLLLHVPLRDQICFLCTPNIMRVSVCISPQPVQEDRYDVGVPFFSISFFVITHHARPASQYNVIQMLIKLLVRRGIVLV